ncbi:MAG: hypothetical protein A2W85_13415 [Bacteroidetes bacterium GWF2_41_31]|nr:MAG: hypothetical protein A2W85_13415 [Bacteroidetes bacterium GWF2_41_31]OFZ02325.1 MAG: hypothetical protein A2338_02750 [Bacteroidetes bacterium RIFOXYB12_FULL_41_6]
MGHSGLPEQILGITFHKGVSHSPLRTGNRQTFSNTIFFAWFIGITIYMILLIIGLFFSTH